MTGNRVAALSVTFYWNACFVAGATWQARRKCLNPSFNSIAIRHVAPIFNRKAAKLVSVLEQFADKQPIDVTKYVLAANLDVMAGRHGKYNKALLNAYDWFEKKILRFVFVHLQKLFSTLILTVRAAVVQMISMNWWWSEFWFYCSCSEIVRIIACVRALSIAVPLIQAKRDWLDFKCGHGSWPRHVVCIRRTANLLSFSSVMYVISRVDFGKLWSIACHAFIERLPFGMTLWHCCCHNVTLTLWHSVWISFVFVKYSFTWLCIVIRIRMKSGHIWMRY